jgi:DNA ligase (NAD+)
MLNELLVVIIRLYYGINVMRRTIMTDLNVENNTFKDKKLRIEELVSKLNEASEAYYNGQEEIMSNYEWDFMYDELTTLEAETGYVLPNSPTQNVGYEESNGEKEQHEFPALSMAKTKNIADLQKWADNRPIWLTWKLDGLTLVLTYDGGNLTKILTRGNGTIGTNITFLKNSINGFPLKSLIRDTW